MLYSDSLRFRKW